jgi:hypothetical protein
MSWLLHSNTIHVVDGDPSSRKEATQYDNNVRCRWRSLVVAAQLLGMTGYRYVKATHASPKS